MTKFELLELLEGVPDDAEIKVDQDGITYDINPLDVTYDAKTKCVTIGGM